MIVRTNPQIKLVLVYTVVHSVLSYAVIFFFGAAGLGLLTANPEPQTKMAVQIYSILFVILTGPGILLKTAGIPIDPIISAAFFYGLIIVVCYKRFKNR